MEDLQAVETAIAAIQAQRPVLGDAVTQTALQPLQARRRELLATAEGVRRKLVTALVADLVGYTRLSEQTDPEDLQRLLAPYFDAWSQVIVEQGGSVEKFIGDAVVAVFGLDVAHEDDPQRAVDAALALRERLTALNAARPDHPALAVRIGIDTGEVLVGSFEERPGMDFVAVGDAVNRASRLQAAAPAEGVLVSADTYRHVRGLYVASEVEPLTLKGVAEPVPAVLVTARKPRQFRIPTRGVQGVPTRTVGRDGELATLKAALHDVAAERRAGVVTVEGDAGVGKSRLLADFDDWLELLPDNVWYFRGRATPTEQNRPFALLRDVVADRLQVADSDPPDLVLSRLADALGAGPGDPDAAGKAAALARLLGFAPEQMASRPYSDDPAGPRQRALEHLADYLRALASVHPVVVLLEDLHWADDSSLDALATVTARLADAAVLVVGTARPSLRERRPHWGEGLEGYRLLRLVPLTRRESRDLLADVLRHADAVPDAVSDLVVTAAEGNPFYLEEMVKWLVDVGVIDTRATPWHVHSERLSQAQVPPTLRAVLQARVDALTERERAVLQRAAVVGRVFWSGAVTALGEQQPEGVPVPPGAVPSLLDLLRSREVVYRRERSAFADDVEFTFKHALLRDVTYDSLLRQQRRRLHAAAARWLEQVTATSGRTDEYAVLIAEHLLAADRGTDAAGWYLRAGRAAFGSSAFGEAVGLLEQARRLAGDDPTLHVRSLLALAAALDRVGDVAGEEGVLSELSARAAGLDDPAITVDVLLAQASWNFRRSAYDESAELAARATSVADGLDDPARQTWARLWRGRARAWQGRHDDARTALADALDHARRAEDPSAISESLRYLAIVANNVSDYPAAEELLGQALAALEHGGSATDRASVLAQLGSVLFNAQRFDEATVRLEEGLHTFSLAGYRYGEAVCTGNLATIAASRGELARALRRGEESLAVVRDINDREGTAITLGLLGDVHRQAGRRDAARSALAESVAIAEELAFDYVQSDSRLLLALVALDDDQAAAAVVLARQAVELARAAQSRLGECRALDVLGWCLLAASAEPAGGAAEAAAAFTQARRLAEGLDLASLAAEAAAGLSGCALAAGDPTEAARFADAALARPPTEGTLVPGLALLTLLRVRAVTQDPDGWRRVASIARAWLADAAVRIEDPGMVAGFRRDVPANRHLADAVDDGAR